MAHRASALSAFAVSAVLVAASLLAAAPAGAATTPAPTPGDEVVLVSVPATAADAVEGLDVVSSHGDELVLLGDRGLEAELAQRGVETLAVQSYAESIDVPPAASASPTPAIPLPTRLAGTAYETYFGGYRTVAAYEAFAHDIAAAYPEIAQLVDYGDSWLKTQGRGGHELYAVRLTADVAAQPAYDDGQAGRPRFVLTTQTHAREIISSELAWRYATELLNGYGSDPQITALLDSSEVWIAFQHNPDGVDLVQQALAAAPLNEFGDAVPDAESQAWQRKNVNDSEFVPTEPTWASQQPGVDLNRNWPFHWGEATTSTDPTSVIYGGPAQGSEPEVTALAELLTELYGSYVVDNDNPAPADRIGAYLNLHAYSDFVLYPYGYSNEAVVPNLDAINASAFRQSYANGWATGRIGEILYNASGNDLDWTYAKLGVPAFNYEVGTAEQGGFFPAYSRVDAFWPLVAPGIRFTADSAAAPYTSVLGGLVDSVGVERTADGGLLVTGQASDNRYGADPDAGDTRPVVTDVTAVEAAFAPTRADITSTTPLALTTAGPVVGYEGTLAAAASNAGAGFVFVRAMNGSGQWGPWAAAFAAAATGGGGDGGGGGSVPADAGGTRLADTGAEAEFVAGALAAGPAALALFAGGLVLALLRRRHTTTLAPAAGPATNGTGDRR